MTPESMTPESMTPGRKSDEGREEREATLAGRRVLIDATAASIGGGYTYLVNVIPRLCELAPDCSYRLLVRSQKLGDVLAGSPNLQVVVLPVAGPVQRLRQTLFAARRLVADWSADLYFSVGEMAPLRLPCPSIASFRNATVFSWEHKAREMRDRIRLNVLYAIARAVARRCDRIVFVSEDSARWIGDALGLPESRRVVVHHGIDAALWQEGEAYRGHPRPYILSVGSIYYYKNYPRLIEAYVQAAGGKAGFPDLVIIGDDYDQEVRAQMEAVRQQAGELATRIHILGGMPYEEVKSYYKGACMFVFPSTIESFGHPLLEAMAAGIPLVASDIPVFREIAGPAARYARHDDVGAMARAIEEVLDPRVAEELVRLGSERIRGFTWEASARKLISLFATVIDESSRSGA